MLKLAFYPENQQGFAASCEIRKSRKNLGSDGIQTRNLCVSSWTICHCTTDPPFKSLNLDCVLMTFEFRFQSINT